MLGIESPGQKMSKFVRDGNFNTVLEVSNTLSQVFDIPIEDITYKDNLLNIQFNGITYLVNFIEKVNE